MWYTRDLTMLYAYSCGLNVLQVVREKSSMGLYKRIEDNDFHFPLIQPCKYYGFRLMNVTYVL